MIKGATPTDIRVRNQLAILDILRYYPHTYFELSEKLDLSTTAISNILKELLEKQLIQSIGVNHTLKSGRPATQVAINQNKYIVCTIALNSTEKNSNFNISIFDLSGRKLESEVFPEILTNEELLNSRILEIINRLLAKDTLKNKTLANICIATPGIVDTNSQIIIATCLQKNDGSYDIRKFLLSHFNVPIYVQNVLVAYLSGERSTGKIPKDSKVSALINLDAGLGIALNINGKPFMGAHGLFGELGFLTTNLSEGANYSLSDRLKNGLENDVSTKALKHMLLSHKEEIPFFANDITLDAIAELFKSNNAVVIREMKKHSDRVNGLIKNIAMLFDVDTLLVGNTLSQFGTFYLDRLKSCLSKNFPVHAHVDFSSGTQCILEGLLSEAISRAFIDTVN